MDKNMDKTYRSEVQFGSLLDLSPEELKMACATMQPRQTSTPKPENVDSGLVSLTAAFEELTKMIRKQNKEVREKAKGKCSSNGTVFREAL